MARELNLIGLEEWGFFKLPPRPCVIAGPCKEHGIFIFEMSSYFKNGNQSQYMLDIESRMSTTLDGLNKKIDIYYPELTLTLKYIPIRIIEL